ncbi:MAG: GFA family protein [Pseudomonadota bacterium]
MANKAGCLCGKVSWEISGAPFHAFNCHCKLCRKAHGAPFGTYWFLESDQFRFTGETDTIVHYRSSHMLVRSFCGECGSVVPYSGGQSTTWVVPGGCHDDGEKSHCNVFVAHKAPWHEPPANLPNHDDYPKSTGYDRVEEIPLPPQPEGTVRGSCMCGTVQFHLTEPFKVVHNCYCTRCRRARAAAHTTNGFTAIEGVTYISGEDRVKTYKVSDAEHFTQAFCEVCGSKVPRKDPNRKIAITPLGALDDDPEATAVDHIYVDYKAKWYDITDHLPQFPEDPA